MKNAEDIANAFAKLYKRLLKAIILVILLGSAVLAAAFSRFAVRSPEFVSKASAVVTDTSEDETVYYDDDGKRVDTDYYVTFTGRYENGDMLHVRQRCTEKLYKKYTSLKGSEIDVFVYCGSDGSLYVSQLAQDKVYKEYRFLHAEGLHLTLMIIFCIFPFLLFGLIPFALWARKLSRSETKIAQVLEDEAEAQTLNNK